jgi:hypothetical protein
MYEVALLVYGWEQMPPQALLNKNTSVDLVRAWAKEMSASEPCFTHLVSDPVPAMNNLLLGDLPDAVVGQAVVSHWGFSNSTDAIESKVCRLFNLAVGREQHAIHPNLLLVGNWRMTEKKQQAQQQKSARDPSCKCEIPDKYYSMDTILPESWMSETFQTFSKCWIELCLLRERPGLIPKNRKQKVRIALCLDNVSKFSEFEHEGHMLPYLKEIMKTSRDVLLLSTREPQDHLFSEYIDLFVLTDPRNRVWCVLHRYLYFFLSC